MVRHTKKILQNVCKILQHLLQEYYSVSDHFGTLYIKGLNFIGLRD